MLMCPPRFCTCPALVSASPLHHGQLSPFSNAKIRKIRRSLPSAAVQDDENAAPEEANKADTKGTGDGDSFQGKAGHLVRTLGEINRKNILPEHVKRVPTKVPTKVPTDGASQVQHSPAASDGGSDSDGEWLPRAVRRRRARSSLSSSDAAADDAKEKAAGAHVAPQQPPQETDEEVAQEATTAPAAAAMAAAGHDTNAGKVGEESAGEQATAARVALEFPSIDVGATAQEAADTVLIIGGAETTARVVATVGAAPPVTAAMEPPAKTKCLSCFLL